MRALNLGISYCFIGLSSFYGGGRQGIWISDIKLFNSFSNDKNPPNLPNGYRHSLYCRRPHLKIFYRIPGQQAPPFSPLQSRRSHLHRGICKFVFMPPLNLAFSIESRVFTCEQLVSSLKLKNIIVIYDTFTSKTGMTIKKNLIHWL